MRWLELRVPPLLVWLLCAGIATGANRLLPGLRVPVPGGSAIAAVLAAVGFVLAASGIAAFLRARTTVHPMAPDRAATVVTSGIYGVTRNPMYLGIALTLLAQAIWLGNLVALSGPVIFVAYMNAFQIAPEERALLAKFGPPFAEYMRTVRRWM